MTKQERIDRKKGNQERKRKLPKHRDAFPGGVIKCTASVLHYGFIQNGKFTK